MVDGDLGLGPVVATARSSLLHERARATGVGLISVRLAPHIAMLQYYTEALASEGLIGIVMTNTESGEAPFGGIDKIFGTDPPVYCGARSMHRCRQSRWLPQ